jgi:hypothetical protein
MKELKRTAAIDKDSTPPCSALKAQVAVDSDDEEMLDGDDDADDEAGGDDSDRRVEQGLDSTAEDGVECYDEEGSDFRAQRRSR